MGIWCSCQAIGNIFSSLLIALILPFGYEVNSVALYFSFIIFFNFVSDSIIVKLVEPSFFLEVIWVVRFQYTFLLNSSLMILVALFVFLIENAPRRCSVPSFNNTHDEDSLNRTGRHLGLFEALLLPGVIPVSFS